jgi:protein SCO1/2
VKRNLLIKLTLGGIGICLLVIVGSFFTDPPKKTEPDPAQLFNPSGNFTLTGTSGEPFQLQDLRGNIVLLFFGYTSCPDACPSTLAKLQRAFNLLTGSSPLTTAVRQASQALPKAAALGVRPTQA